MCFDYIAQYVTSINIYINERTNDGETFIGWKLNGTYIFDSDKFFYTVTEDVKIKAVFSDDKSEQGGELPNDKKTVSKRETKKNNNPDEGEIYVFPFKDVATNAWYYDAVRYVNYNRIMDGTGDGTTFLPNDKCTREMVVQILYNAEGRNSVNRNNPFDDVKKGKWYYNSILWGLENGITEGTSTTTFGVGKSVTRQEMAGFLYNYSKWKGYSVDDVKELDEFDDANEVSGWAVDKMKWAVANGIINGKSKAGMKLLDSKGTATRAEVAQMIKNYECLYND